MLFKAKNTFWNVSHSINTASKLHSTKIKNKNRLSNGSPPPLPSPPIARPQANCWPLVTVDQRSFPQITFFFLNKCFSLFLDWHQYQMWGLFFHLRFLNGSKNIYKVFMWKSQNILLLLLFEKKYGSYTNP